MFATRGQWYFYIKLTSFKITIYKNLNRFFIATQKGLIYFEKMERTYTFCNVGAKKIWNINDKLYVLFDDGKFAVIYPVNMFEGFTQV